MNLFPFADYWSFYLLFIGFISVILFLDLGVFHRKEHVVSFKEATIWSILFVALALLFNLALYQYSFNKFGAEPAWNLSLEFLTGYVVEKSLSVDNIFIFVMVFRYFAIPLKFQHRVLFYGLLGAVIFRAIFIALGSSLMQFHWVLYLFGGFLIVTGIKMYFASEKEIEPEKNFLIRILKKFIPVTGTIEGKHFFIRKDGYLAATPLFVALLFLEFTDVVFAIDSVPAIFALTNEPLIVFTSNIFAILGLRSMYFMLAGAVEKFHLLKFGLATVLVFVGLKMVLLNDWYGGKFPITYSLGIIVASIGASIAASLLFPKTAKSDPLN